MTAYYNEHDPFAAAWLRELIADGLIAPGEVDERSIEDVTPYDLRPFRQCHFFAGIGVWSLAARRSGIPDDAPLWTGSCPCQPFSSAGKGGGFDDQRHLWPAFHFLIEQCAPILVVGEQVAGRDGDTWLDLVQSDVEATGYAFGAAETVACGFGAPHKRSRNYWAAHRLGNPNIAGLERHDRHGFVSRQSGRLGARSAGPDHDASRSGSLADADDNGQRATRASGREQSARDAQSGGAVQRVANAASERRIGRRSSQAGNEPGSVERLDGFCDASAGRGRPGPTNGLWRNADWLRCRDEKWRPVEPGTFPLVDAGTFRNRVGLLREAGNAITLGQAEGFLRAVIGSIAA